MKSFFPPYLMVEKLFTSRYAITPSRNQEVLPIEYPNPTFAEQVFDDKGFEVIWENSGWRRKDQLAARAMSSSGTDLTNRNTTLQSNSIPLYWPLATAAFAFKK